MQSLLQNISSIPLKMSQHLVKHQTCCIGLQKCFSTRQVTFSLFQAARSHLLKHNKLVKGFSSQHIRKVLTKAGFGGKEISLHDQKIVGYWLMGCAGMVVGAVILGGVTRLTESGLSMVDWRLWKDMKPPTSEQQWEEEFERYKQFPEYKYVSLEKGEMTLSQFKFIFYMEYAHRMWGRAVGLVFLIPAIYFWKKKMLFPGMKPRVALYTLIIGFQGFLGWYMVKSGLEDKPESVDIPRVSQYRLAAHLGSALFLFTLFLHAGLQHLVPIPEIKDFHQLARVRGMAHVVLTAVFVTALSGAFVAGLDAGLTYNSWPKMADRWIPDDLWAISPKWRNIFENPTTVQFDHRLLAHSTAALVTGFWLMCRKYPLPRQTKLALNSLLGIVFVQATLGISTLLLYVPTWLAACHQSGSVALLSCAVWVIHMLKKMPK